MSDTIRAPDITPEVRAYIRYLASKGGKASMSREKRSVLAKLNSKKAWAKRRAKYGWQGYDRSKSEPRTARKVMERVCAKCPELWNHPVWDES